MNSEQQTPSLYQWAGGKDAFQHLTSVFYGKVLDDPLLYPVFASMAADHPQRVAKALSEVFGGPADYTAQRGGHRQLIMAHLHRHLSEQQRARWVQLLLQTADEIGFPGDPEFRAAFVSYLEWGSRIALAVSQSDDGPREDLDPMPRWDWIIKPFQAEA